MVCLVCLVRGSHRSALHYAALNGDETLAGVLMAAGADPEISTMQGGAIGETAAVNFY